VRYPLELTLRPSRRLQAMIAAIHGVAAIAFLHSSLAPVLVGATVLALICSSIYLMHVERKCARSVIVLEDSGLLTLHLCERVVSAVPLGGSVDFGWAVWLHWQELGADGLPTRTKGALMLLPDHVPATVWRPLRIWLRHKSVRDLFRPAPASGSGPERS
jgi:toxin CptA